jgi:hypothetical protein
VHGEYGTSADISSAAGGWHFLSIARADHLRLGRGSWRPRIEHSAAFLDLSIAVGWIGQPGFTAAARG